MKFGIICEECFTAYQVSYEMIGRKVRCKHCGQPITVFAPPPSEPVSPPAPAKPAPPSDALPILAVARPALPLTADRTISPRTKIVVGVLLTLALMLFVTAGWEWYIGADSKSWPQTPGRIVDSRRELTDSGGMQQLPTTSYTVKFAYEYLVDGERYRSDRVAISLFAVGGLVETYEEGSVATVYYQPGNPRLSVLQPGVSWATVILYVTVAMLLFGIGVLCLIVR